MLTRRGFLSAGLTSALTATGCGFGRRPEAPIRLVVTPWVGNSPFYVAKERRFFGDVDLRIASFGTDFDAWRALADQRADFTTGTMFDILRGSEVGVDLQVVSVTDFSNGADGIVGAGVERIADLAGKRVGVEVGTLTHFVLIRALERAGLTEESVHLDNMSMEEAITAMDKGKIDAAPFWEPFLGKAAAAPGRKLLFTSSEIPGEIVDVVAAQSHAIESRPGFVTTLLQGWERGLRLLLDAPDEALPLAVKYLEMKPEELRVALSGIRLVSHAESRKMFDAAAKPSIFAAYDNAVRFAKKHGILTREPKPPETLFAAGIRDRDAPG
ncbi:MAG: ABC transporter substrate-binding protein [Polyangiaceae bacterium]